MSVPVLDSTWFKVPTEEYPSVIVPSIVILLFTVAVSTLMSNAWIFAFKIMSRLAVFPCASTCCKSGVNIGGSVTQSTPVPVLVSTWLASPCDPFTSYKAPKILVSPLR